MQMMDLSGRRFGRLVAVERAISQKGKWRCLCDCGKEVFVTTQSLTCHRTKSCGCFNKDFHTLHGYYGTPTYKSWISMNYRCNPNKTKRNPRYDGRGIIVCERWKRFENFLEDMGERPVGCTLDRIDVNGNYEKSNCRWATPKEQRNNQAQRKLNPERGVYKRKNSWIACVGNGKRLYFKTMELAREARLKFLTQRTGSEV